MCDVEIVSAMELEVTIVSAKGLRNADTGWFDGKSDPYCICGLFLFQLLGIAPALCCEVCNCWKLKVRSLDFHRTQTGLAICVHWGPVRDDSGQESSLVLGC